MQWHLTDLKPSDGIRWAVGDRTGRRSSTFRAWGNKKGDFYLSARALGGSLKTSLHRDGRCHTGFTNDYAAQIGSAARHMDRWTIPLGKLTKAVQVVVTETDLDVYESDEKEPMRWLRAPRPDHIAIVGVVTLPTAHIQALDNSWPGAEVGTEPVGIIASKDRTAFVLHWENALAPQQKDQLDALRNRLAIDGRAKGIAVAPGLRGILIGQIVDGETVGRSLIDMSYRPPNAIREFPRKRADE